MFITFLIGNGFDVNLGLNTRYSDFYPVFLKKAQEDNMIREWISDNVDEWSDLEIGLGHNLAKVSNDVLQVFYSSKDELDLLLGQYIEEQQNKISDEMIQKMSEEFVRSIIGFEYGLPVEYKSRVQKIKNTFFSEEFEYHFIDFNYTNIIDRLVDLTRQKGAISKHVYKGIEKKKAFGNVVHVHGTTDSNMILGINDITQINNISLVNNEELQEYIIKERINAGLKENIVRRAKDKIDNSHIICIYGMSLGDTDNMWWQYIINWLQIDNRNVLIIYSYYKNIDELNKLPARKNQKLNEVINRFLRKKEMSDDIYINISSRIFVVFENNIFNFDEMDNNLLGIQDKEAIPNDKIEELFNK